MKAIASPRFFAGGNNPFVVHRVAYVFKGALSFSQDSAAEGLVSSIQESDGVSVLNFSFSQFYVFSSCPYPFEDFFLSEESGHFLFLHSCWVVIS